ncbi:MAG: STAS domain-containing protein [Tabrizicola sp.]|nr:STAS domain-containing protein [Tabrizicola sp.]MDZ4085933.1 STAS domain-containing protein [Tabrizicola sp.]
MGLQVTYQSFSLPEVVDLTSAKKVAADLLHHITSVPAPSVDASRLRQAGVPLLQILVASKRFADTQGKPFSVEASPDGTLSKLLSNHGLDPSMCGASTELAPAAATLPSERTDG